MKQLTAMSVNVPGTLHRKWNFRLRIHCVKSVQIRSDFWPAFSCIRTEYVNLRVRSEYRKIQTRKTLYLDTFHAVISSVYMTSSEKWKTSYFAQRESVRIIRAKIWPKQNFWKSFGNFTTGNFHTLLIRTTQQIQRLILNIQLLQGSILYLLERLSEPIVLISTEGFHNKDCLQAILLLYEKVSNE